MGGRRQDGNNLAAPEMNFHPLTPLAQAFNLKMASRSKERSWANPSNDIGAHKSNKALKQMRIDSYFPIAEAIKNVSSRSRTSGSPSSPKNLQTQKPGIRAPSPIPPKLQCKLV